MVPLFRGHESSKESRNNGTNNIAQASPAPLLGEHCSTPCILQSVLDTFAIRIHLDPELRRLRQNPSRLTHFFGITTFAVARL